LTHVQWPHTYLTLIGEQNGEWTFKANALTNSLSSPSHLTQTSLSSQKFHFFLLPFSQNLKHHRCLTNCFKCFGPSSQIDSLFDSYEAVMCILSYFTKSVKYSQVIPECPFWFTVVAWTQFKCNIIMSRLT